MQLNGKAWMRSSKKGCLALIMAWALVSGCSESVSTSAVFEVAAGADGWFYGLVPGNCIDGRCAAIIQLRQGAKLLDTFRLGFAASARELRRDGDDQNNHATAWTAGTEEGTVTTVLRPIRLSSTNFALLIDQTAGFDHLKRRHDILGREANRLRRFWESVEGAGPTWSAVEIIPTPGGRADEIIELQGFSPGDASPDTLSVNRLVWDENRREWLKRTVETIPAIVVGEFVGVLAARKASLKACLSGYWVLPAEAFGGEPGHFVLAQVSSQVQELAKTLAQPCQGVDPRRQADFKPSSVITSRSN
jgi:hypothetical protein